MVTVDSDTIEAVSDAFRELDGRSASAQEVLEVAVELEALQKALLCSLNGLNYIRMRRDAQSEDGEHFDAVKMTFSASVNIDNKFVDASMKGSIKLNTDSCVAIQDPAQGEFDFGPQSDTEVHGAGKEAEDE